jgi:lipid-binding SYLF domain-containing protein
MFFIDFESALDSYPERGGSRMNKNLLRTLFILALIGFLVGCASPKGVTKQEQRASVSDMKQETLAKLYAQKPETKGMIKKAAGYGVFSNIGTYVFLLAGSNGYGIVVDNSTGKNTYMKMRSVGVGMGMGVKDFRAVFIFKNKEVLNEFVEKGWEFGGQADAAAKSGDKGGAINGEAYIETDIIIYELTEAGVALQATVGGTKFWKDKSLN